jgi:catechol O-methyltransferase
MPGTAPPKYHGMSYPAFKYIADKAEPVQGTVYHGDGREEALLKHLQSLPSLSSDKTKDLSLQDRSQRVLDAIHEFGKGENRYLMSVGDTKGKQVEQIIKDKKPKVSLS